jgi:Holliday junction resolvase RusA-like endonuclease
MENEIVISIIGSPKPKARGRIAGDKQKDGSLKNPRIVSIVNPAEKRWEGACKQAMREAVRSLGVAGVVEILGRKTEPLRMVAVFRIPTTNKARWGSLHSLDGRSDTDNLVKLLKDSLWNCGIPGALLGGDGRVSVEHVCKVWSSGKDAGCTVRIARAGKACDELERVMRA